MTRIIQIIGYLKRIHITFLLNDTSNNLLRKYNCKMPVDNFGMQIRETMTILSYHQEKRHKVLKDDSFILSSEVITSENKKIDTHLS